MTSTRDPRTPLLSVQDLSHEFVVGGGLLGPARTVQALSGVGFDVQPGECLGIVGESGAGKTTLARCVLRLLEPTGGKVFFKGQDVLVMDREALQAFRGQAQIVFQDPYGSLNPRLRAGPMLEEIVQITGRATRPSHVDDLVHRLLELVGLQAAHWGRYPHELSGGQRQRLGIARALSVGPEFLVLDEPVSSLDFSVQAQILSLLKELQERLNLTLLLVAHDLAAVKQMANRVAVLHKGMIVEISTTRDLFEAPSHPYSRNLLETVGWKETKGASQGLTRP